MTYLSSGPLYRAPAYARPASAVPAAAYATEAMPVYSADIDIPVYQGRGHTPYMPPFDPRPFLLPGRPEAQFVGRASQLESVVREAFTATTGQPLPYGITIHVNTPAELKGIHSRLGGVWSEGIQGFALNSRSSIFLREGPLDEVLLVAGHELGHVLTPQLPSMRDEEAKAFAFELAWMQAIHREDIAGLRGSIRLGAPARNGLHNVALDFVLGALRKGADALELFRSIAAGTLSASQKSMFITTN